MCTSVRFTNSSGNLYFGRNLDWEFGYGEKPLITPSGWTYSWKHVNCPDEKRPVIGMGIVIDDTPLYFDCMNSEGLAIAGLFFSGFAQYETAPVFGKLNLNSYEFLLWVTRNFSSVEQLKPALSDVAIIGEEIGGFDPSPLHWIISDSNQCIVVEYMADGIHVHDNPVDVLANQPTFDWQLENLRSYYMVSPEVPPAQMWGKKNLEAYGSGGGMRGLPGDYYSTSRFVRAAYLNARYPVQKDEWSNVVRLFRTLEGVSMIEGASIMKTGNFEKTVYTSGYSSETQSVFHSTYENPSINSWSLKDYDANGTSLLLLDD